MRNPNPELSETSAALRCCIPPMKPIALLSLFVMLATPASVFADPFDNLDKDKDGKLSSGELPPALRRNLAAVDKNNDGFIDRDEDKIIRERNRRQAPGDSGQVPGSVKAKTDIPYADSENPAQRLDLYLPAKPAGEKPLPVIVYIHGGAWRAGSKTGGRSNLMPYVTGGEYAGVSVEYRFSQEAKWPAQIHDCKAAVRWIKGHAKEYNLDPDRIAVWGGSAGGHLVAMLGVSGDVKELEGALGNHLDQSSRVTCVADYFGPTDLLTMGDFPSTIDHNAADSPESVLIGGAIPENREAASKASPLNYVTKDDAPVFIAHGTKDNMVPFNQSEIFAAALKGADVPVHFQMIEDGGHGGFEGPKLNARLRAFFGKYLSGAETTIETGKLKPRE